MQLIKITAILLLIALGAQASDTPTPSDACYDVNDCMKRSLRYVGFINARRANKVAESVASPEKAV